MTKIIEKFNLIFMNKQFFKFLVIGVINTFNATIFSTLYGVSIDTNIAFILGYITSLCIAYILNSRFIFYKRLSLIGGVKFGVSYIPNFIIQNITVFIIYNLLGLPSIVAYILSAIIGIPITFIVIKVFAFKNK